MKEGTMHINKPVSWLSPHLQTAAVAPVISESCALAFQLSNASGPRPPVLCSPLDRAAAEATTQASFPPHSIFSSCRGKFFTVTRPCQLTLPPLLFTALPIWSGAYQFRPCISNVLDSMTL